MMRLLAALLALAACGCSSRAKETGAAAVQAQQASQATAKIAAAPAVHAALANLTPEQRAVVEQALRSIVDLSVQASDSLVPVIRRLAVIEPAAPVQTTVDMAIEQPAEFVRQAGRQAARAEIETEAAEASARFQVALASWGAEVGGSLLSQGLLGGGLGGLLLAAGGVALKARKAFTTVQAGYAQAKAAVEDAVAAGVDLAKAKTDEQVEAVKTEHAKRQEANGTRGLIKPLVAKAKLTAQARDATAV